MAKAQKTRGAGFWIGKVISTTDIQKMEIVDNILGIDLDDEGNREEAEEIMGKIRVIVGSYSGAVESIDKKPRPANYLADLNGTEKNKDGTLKEGLRRQSFDLSESISNLSHWMTEEFEEQGFNLHEFHLQIATFLQVCSKIEKKYEDMPSPGRPKELAKEMVINYLNAVFEKYYSILPLDDNDDENDKRRNAKERDRIKFLRTCLAIGNIPCPKTDSALMSLLYAEKDPPEEKIGFTIF